MALILSPLVNIPLIKPGDNLVDLFLLALEPSNIHLEDGDVLVIAQKVISKSEDRFINLSNISPSDRAVELANKTEKDPRLVELILRESKEVLRYRPGTIIVEHRLGFVCANAGIDHSNVVESNIGEEWVLLLPVEPDLSAEKISRQIEAKTGKNVGVLIIDSHGRAWRLGVVGITIGISGVPGLVDFRGKKDLFDYTLNVTQVAAADELAAAASLMMGQAAERTPVVHVRGFPYSFRESSLKELLRPKEQDLFR